MRYDKHRTLWKERRGDDVKVHSPKAESDRILPRPDKDWADRQRSAEVEMQDPERWDGMS